MVIKNTPCLILCGRNMGDYFLVLFSTLMFLNISVGREAFGGGGKEWEDMVRCGEGVLNIFLQEVVLKG